MGLGTRLPPHDHHPLAPVVCSWDPLGPAVPPCDPHPPAPAMHPRQPHHSAPAIPTPPSHPTPQVRAPFHQLHPFNLGMGQSGRKLRPASKAPLPSSAINKAKPIPPKTVIQSNPSLMCPSKVPTLTLKLAKESFFGEEVMARCTVAGSRELPALPATELNHLKSMLLTLLPQYWRSPHEFEPVWNLCTSSIGQGCNRLRRNGKTFL